MKVKIVCEFIDLVRPDSWFYPLDTEQAFGVLGWMIDTGQEYASPGRWGQITVEGLLSCKPTCTNFQSIDPIGSIADLRHRFNYAILANVGKMLQAWRDDYDIRVGGRAEIRSRHYGIMAGHGPEGISEASLRRRIDSLLAASGRLAVSLNSCHKQAREINGVRAYYARGQGWYFDLLYGYDGSMWHHLLAEQGRKEPFLDTFLRAEDALAKLSSEETVFGYAPIGGIEPVEDANVPD